MGPRGKDGKLIKTKPCKADAEKADQSSKQGFLYDNPFKFSPQTKLKDSSSSLDYTKSLGTFIPPINQNFSPTLGMGSGPGNLNYRYGAELGKLVSLIPVMSWEVQGDNEGTRDLGFGIPCICCFILAVSAQLIPTLGHF